MTRRFSLFWRQMGKHTVSMVLCALLALSLVAPASASYTETDTAKEPILSALDVDGNQVDLTTLDDSALHDGLEAVADAIGYESDALLPYIYEVASRAESMSDDELVSIYLDDEEGVCYRRAILEVYLKKNDFVVNDERLLDALEAGHLSESDQALILAMIPGSVLNSERILSILSTLVNSDNDTIAFHAIKSMGKIDLESAVVISQEIIANIENEPTAKVSAAIKVLEKNYKEGEPQAISVDENDFVDELERIYISNNDEEIRFVTLNILKGIDSEKAVDVVATLEAQTPAPQAMELGLGGYAAYRDGVSGSFPGVDNLQWHAAMIVSKSWPDINLVHAPGGKPGALKPTEFADYATFLNGNTEIGYYRPSSATASFDAEKRQAITNTAREIGYNRIPYYILVPIQYDSVPSSQYYYSPDDIKTIRCDGVVEYCYEYNLIRVSGVGNTWNIARNDTSSQMWHEDLVHVNPKTQATQYMVKIGKIH